MQRLEVSGTVRPLYGSLDVKRLMNNNYALEQRCTNSGRWGPNICGPSRMGLA